MLAEKALVALTDLKRLASDCDLPVHDMTRDLVGCALKTACILFVESDRSRRVRLLNEAPLVTPPRRTRRNCIPESG